MASNSDGGSFVTGFLVGGIIGAVVGVLLAPKSGSETRAELMERSETWRTRAEELALQARERVGPTMEGVRERVGPAVEEVRERIGPVADRVASRVGRGASKAGADDGGSESDAAVVEEPAPGAKAKA